MLSVASSAMRRAWGGVLLAAVVLVPSDSLAQDAAVAWDVFLRTSQPATEFRAMASGESTVFVGAIDRSSVEPGAESNVRLRVWTLGPDGRSRAEADLDDTTAPRSNTRTIRDIAALPNGEALVLVDFVAGQPSLVRLNAKGEQASVRRVLTDNRFLALTRVIAMPGGQHLLVGNESFNAIAVMVDASGAPLWDRVYDRGRTDYFTDGVATPDGGAVLVGNTGTYDATRSGESQVWVGRYDAKGLAGPEVTFPGRYGRVALAPDGGVVVVYDRATNLERDVHVKRIGPDQREVWDIVLDLPKDGRGDLRIVARPDGSFVVAGISGGAAHLTYLDLTGRTIGSWLASRAPRALDLGTGGIVLDGDGDVVVAGSHVLAESKTNVKYQVRVRRLAGGPAQRGL